MASNMSMTGAIGFTDIADEPDAISKFKRRQFDTDMEFGQET